jgi:hypothetical protein
MVGTTGSIRPGHPWAGNSPPRQFVQFLILAGHQLIPARDIEARAAKMLLEDMEVRVFSDALDRNWRVEMSRAKIAGDPNGAADCVLVIGKHCTYNSSPFVPSVTKKGFLTPFGSRSREYHPRNATGGGSLGHNYAGARCRNVQRDDLHPKVNDGRGAQPKARRTGIELAGVFLRSEVARAAMDERDLSGERGCAVSIHVFPANRRESRPEGRKRGLKACR